MGDNSGHSRWSYIDVIGAPPPFAEGKENWIIHNAPRPLACSGSHKENLHHGDFISGVFYAFIDPQDPRASELIAENRKLDASMLQWIDPAVHAQCVAAWVREYYIPTCRKRYGKNGRGDKVEADVRKLSPADLDRAYRRYKEEQVRIVGPLVELVEL